jgi:hypothetical protein
MSNYYSDQPTTDTDALKILRETFPVAYVVMVKRPQDNEGNWTWTRLAGQYDTRRRAEIRADWYRSTGHVAQVRGTDEF